MKKYIYFLFFILITQHSIANDGAFFASGNHLIPINETTISVQKEILKLKKIDNNYIEVSVYYEFFNPNEAKEIIVGFEAFAPYGDVNGAPKNGKHPYMSDFTINMNGINLQYKVAYVSDTFYNKNGIIQSIDLKNFKGNTAGNNVDFFYVYHFKAKFKKGLNIVKHTYKYSLSGSIDEHYAIDYILTAANRWSNKQIDDFTLILDMGEFETFSISKNFFKSANEWTIKGIGKTENIDKNTTSIRMQEALKFYIQNGVIEFKQLNFKPKGELIIYAQNFFGTSDFSYLPYSYYLDGNINEPKNDFEKRVLKNLPFARRGYVFKDKQLSAFFEQLDWYMPNPNYVPNTKSLSPREIKWIAKWQ